MDTRLKLEIGCSDQPENWGGESHGSLWREKGLVAEREKIEAIKPVQLSIKCMTGAKKKRKKKEKRTGGTLS